MTKTDNFAPCNHKSTVWSEFGGGDLRVYLPVSFPELCFQPPDGFPSTHRLFLQEIKCVNHWNNQTKCLEFVGEILGTPGDQQNVFFFLEDQGFVLFANDNQKSLISCKTRFFKND